MPFAANSLRSDCASRYPISPWLAVPPEAMGDSLALAYALTVHKAQGSEHDQILLLLPEQPLPLFTRELLYTALSRARHAVVMCGSAEVLASGTVTSLTRSSGLAADAVGRLQSSLCGLRGNHAATLPGAHGEEIA